MYTLSKHKKKGVDGFKEFVKNLELFPSKTVQNMIFIGLLEDPVYLKWALQNRISFQYFKELSPEDVMKIYDFIRMPLQTFISAMKSDNDEPAFVGEKLPEPLQRQYWEEREGLSVTFARQDQARISIMEKVLELEKRGILPKINWKIPPSDVLEGNSFEITDDGIYIQYYQNGKFALRGMLENRLRAGTWEHFYPDGNIFAVGIYINGEKNDDWTFYYPDGCVKMQGSFKDDLREGKWVFFSQESDDESVVYFKEGKVIDSEQF